MSNFTDFIGGGGGGGSFPTIFLHNSQTWVPPQDGNIMIHVIGAGGSGAGSTGSGIQSGAAGGYCRKNSLAVTTSGSFTVVVGAGGVSQIGSSGAGTAGGVTSIAGTGLLVLRGFGGAGGALSTGTYTTGGVATGGDVNYTGGRGGYQRGGGAVGLSGTGEDGGNFNSSSGTYGANCDVLGDFYSSSFGQLSGGGGGVFYISSTITEQITAGELAGAGNCVTAVGPLASHASVGGGGGATLNSTSTKIISGRGGEGCVVIQYIP